MNEEEEDRRFRVYTGHTASYSNKMFEDIQKQSQLALQQMDDIIDRKICSSHRTKVS